MLNLNVESQFFAINKIKIKIFLPLKNLNINIVYE